MERDSAMKRLGRTLCRLLSILLNLFIVCAEPIALPMSWDWGHEGMFTFYTEDSNIFAAIVCAMVAVCQLVCLFTDGQLPRWLKQLKFMAASCLTLTLLTVVFVLAPMYGEGGYYVMLCTSSMLYHHLLNPLAAILSFVLFERQPCLAHSGIWLTLVPTLIYGVNILYLNLIHLVDGPYPFLRIYDQSVQVSALWVVVIGLMAYTYAWLLWKLGGNSPKKPKRRPGLVIR